MNNFLLKKKYFTVYLHHDCLKSNCICLQKKNYVKESEYIFGKNTATFSCMHFLCALSRVFLTVY